MIAVHEHARRDKLCDFVCAAFASERDVAVSGQATAGARIVLKLCTADSAVVA
jgi:hypothetical protein